MTKKTNFKNEISLNDIFFLIWNERKIIFLTIGLAIILAFIYLKSQASVVPVYKASTDIRPISSFDEFEYETYNNFIQNKIYEKKNNEISIIDFNYKKIDKKYLINLFIEKLSEDSYLSDLIEKAELLNKNDYNNIKEYDDAIFNLKNKINFNPITDNNFKQNNWKINFVTEDKDKWENFLKIAEKSTNLEIKNFLLKKFNSSILNEKQLVDFKLDDINSRLTSEMKDDILQNNLRKQKQLLETDESVQRLKIIFNTTPVINSTKFFAARLKVESTNYVKINDEIDEKSILLVGGVLGALIGILYALIFSRTLQARRK